MKTSTKAWWACMLLAILHIALGQDHASVSAFLAAALVIGGLEKNSGA